MSNTDETTPATLARLELKDRLSRFQPRKPQVRQNDPALEAFVSGVVDFTRPANTEEDNTWT